MGPSWPSIGAERTTGGWGAEIREMRGAMKCGISGVLRLGRLLGYRDRKSGDADVHRGVGVGAFGGLADGLPG